MAIYRRSYAGVLRGTTFERSKVKTIDDFSEAEQEAIIEDMIASKIQKVEELTERIQRHRLRQQLLEEAEAELSKRQELELAAEQEERAAARAAALAAFEARVSAEERRRRAEEAEMIQRLRQQDEDRKEKVKQAELERCRLRDQRLARHRRLMADRFKRPRPAAKEASQPEKVQPRRPRSAPAGSAAAVARSRGLHNFADSLDAAHGRYLLRSRPSTASRLNKPKVPKAEGAPSELCRPKSAAALCVTCGQKVSAHDRGCSGEWT